MGQTATATYTPTVLPPAAPEAVDDVSSGFFNSNQTMDVLSNDSSFTGVRLDPSLVKLVSSSGALVTSVTVLQGVYTLNSNGTITFDPNDGFVGTADPVTYKIVDSFGGSDTAIYTPTVLPPSGPTASNDTSSDFINVDQVKNVLANDSAATGVDLDPSSLRLCAAGETAPACNQTSVAISGQGVFTANPNGTITFDPIATFTGVATSVTYSVADQFGQRASATYTPTVISPPSAFDDTPAPGPSGIKQVVDVLANDTVSPDSRKPFDANSILLCIQGQIAPNCAATTLTTADGIYTVENGKISFVPDSDFSGTATVPVRYQVRDGDGQVATAIVTVSVLVRATADPETSSGSLNMPQTVDLIHGDTPSNPAIPLDRSTVTLSCTVPTNCTVTNNGSRVEIAGVGTYELSSANPGFVTFTPVTDFVGEADSVTYTIQDSNGPISSTYTPTVVDIPPKFSKAPADEPQSRSVLENHSGLDPETLQLRHPITQEILNTNTVQVPDQGTFELRGTVITFTPNTEVILANLLDQPSRQNRFYEVDDNGNQVLDRKGRPILIRVEADINPISFQARDSNGVIVQDTYYPVVTFSAPVASPDFSRGPANEPQSQKVLTNDATSGTKLLSETLELVAPSTGEVIGENKVSIPDEGTFTFDGESIVFTPDMSALVEMLKQDLVAHQRDYSRAKLREVWENGVYLGLEADITTITYTVEDEFGFLVTTNYTPEVFFPKPSATPDYSRGAVNEPQRTDVIANDSPSRGIAFEADYLKIWNPVSNSWGITPVETEEGVYTVEAAEGITLQTAGFGGSKKTVLATGISAAGENSLLVFTPRFNWTGTATPVRYQLRDVFGQTVESTKTPTIEGETIVSAINKLARTGGEPLQFVMAIAAGLFTIGMSLKISASRRRTPVSF
jgi:CshA-type fibril repeat protein